MVVNRRIVKVAGGWILLETRMSTGLFKVQPVPIQRRQVQGRSISCESSPGRSRSVVPWSRFFIDSEQIRAGCLWSCSQVGKSTPISLLLCTSVGYNTSTVGILKRQWQGSGFAKYVWQCHSPWYRDWCNRPWSRLDTQQCREISVFPLWPPIAQMLEHLYHPRVDSKQWSSLRFEQPSLLRRWLVIDTTSWGARLFLFIY